MWFCKISDWAFIWRPQMIERVLKNTQQNGGDSDWIVRKWHVHEILSAGDAKMKMSLGQHFWMAVWHYYWNVWECPQTAEHDPSISAKFGEALGVPLGLSKPLPGPTPASGHPRVHFASQQVPRTEAAREVPVALIAQEIFQVYLIFEHRQSLPGKRAHCICSFCLSALALLVANICKWPQFRKASVYVQC